ncbi:unnamed protein product [Parascedosporium putredinis]|uniref:Glycoside hydrolase family 93 protein n=1 Tax=Parascedosporium putredinis TaxID=1442378 RepID=A0A9P1H4M6_9PEZI|nr:unnamed protein product [Parascedosporium putredinis]CAI7995796.1 unnamed protein product [Parascedosporium putredinis]
MFASWPMATCTPVLRSPVAAKVGGSSRRPQQNGNDVYTTFANKVIFTPEANFTDPRPPLVHFPIFESRDHGATWKEISQVHDTVNGWGLRYQPDLFELPRAVGEFPAGTIICSGNSIPTDLSQTQIDVYASRDKGRTWEFVSHVAAGGVAIPVNEETPMHEDTVILYYADQRPEGHGQVISHQTTQDLRAWSDVVHDIIYDDPTDRPGMPSVARFPDGRYIYAYEYGGDPAFSDYRFPIHYRIAEDPTKFHDAPDHLVASNGRSPTTGPYIGEVWSNKALGDPAAWKYHAVPQPSAYTRNLRIFKDRPDLMIIAGAGYLPPATPTRSASASST